MGAESRRKDGGRRDFPDVRSDIQKKFEDLAYQMEPTTTNRLLGLLFGYALGSKYMIEIGVSNPHTTFALLHALEVGGGGKLVSIDIQNGYPQAVRDVEAMAKKAGLDFRFIEINSLSFSKDQIGRPDFVFIDSLHEDAHLRAELDRYAPRTKRRIAFHDTYDPCHLRGSVETWLESPKGVEWKVVADYRMSHGFTVIERKEIIP